MDETKNKFRNLFLTNLKMAPEIIDWRRYIFFTITLFIQAYAFLCNAQEDAAPNLTGPYLGQKPPGITPEVFAPGIISTGLEHSAAMFTPDGTEVWFGRLFPARINFMQSVNGQWSEPQIAPFCDAFNYLYPVLSPDGNQIYFTSDRPIAPNGKSLSRGKGDIWVVERILSGWSSPKHLDENINFSGRNSCGSLSEIGNLFFTAQTTSQSTDLYFSKQINGAYTSAVNLKKVNSSSPDHCPFIAPDESYLIFSSFRGGMGRSDLFICFRNHDGSWTEPRNMGEGINSEWKDEYPYVTPDEKYLFFNSNRPSFLNQEPIEDGPGNIYWVDAQIIQELKKQTAKR